MTHSKTIHLSELGALVKLTNVTSYVRVLNYNLKRVILDDTIRTISELYTSIKFENIIVKTFDEILRRNKLVQTVKLAKFIIQAQIGYIVSEIQQISIYGEILKVNKPVILEHEIKSDNKTVTIYNTIIAFQQPVTAFNVVMHLSKPVNVSNKISMREPITSTNKITTNKPVKITSKIMAKKLIKSVHKISVIKPIKDACKITDIKPINIKYKIYIISKLRMTIQLHHRIPVINFNKIEILSKTVVYLNKINKDINWIQRWS